MNRNISLDFSKCRIEQLNAEQLRQASSILYSAYHDDPLFMQIFQADKPDFEARLRAAIREELATFWDKQQPVLGLFCDEQLLGVACLTEPDAGFQGERLWHWRLKMLLTAGYLSSRQMLDKEKKVHEAMPAASYHMLAFIARNPAYYHPDAMSHFLNAIDHWVDQHPGSEGVGVFVTLDKYLPFFHQDQYKVVGQLDFQKVSGKLLFRRRQQLQGILMSGQPFKTFRDFYPYYLQEHQLPLCRALHYCGSTLVLFILGFAIFSAEWQLLWLMPVAGYGFAWVGHFFVEHNKPATFRYPVYSLVGDWVMYAEFLTGRLAASLAASDPKRR